MIVRNDAEQWIGCDICNTQIELTRKTVSESETLLILEEELSRDHADCEQYKHDPRTAALQRGYKVRMRNEIAKAAGLGRDRRRAL